MLLFWEISEDNYTHPFSIGECWVDSPGQYVLAYSIFSNKDIQKAHQASLMIDWGKLHVSANDIPYIYVFPVDAIHSPISAVPYKVDDTIVDATEWMFLRPKMDWYDIFINKMNDIISQKKINTK